VSEGKEAPRTNRSISFKSPATFGRLNLQEVSQSCPTETLFCVLTDAFAPLNNQNNVQECRNLKSHHCEASVSGGTGMPIAGESNAYQPLSVPEGDDPTAPADGFD
jgi:hypothetical protein